MDMKLRLKESNCQVKLKPDFVWGRTNEFTIEDIFNYNPRLSFFVLNENAVSRLSQACS